jgi:hypothetical protein
VARYAVANTTATGCDIGEAVAFLWNPSSTVALRLVFLGIGHAGATAGMSLRLSRIDGQGTGGTTYTADADDGFRPRAAPPSGAFMKMGNFTTSPTEVTPELWRITLHDAAANQHWNREWQKRSPLMVPAGSGLAIFSPVALTAVSSEWEWDE